MPSKITKVKSTKSPSARVKSSVAKTTRISAGVFNLQGKKVATVTLPKEIFGQKPNNNLLAQAIRIYYSNSLPATAHTKTRGEVRGGGAKPWRQKGTGRARAGSNRSPLWVGGGITFGPRAQKIKLTLPQKMKHKALVYALSTKANSGNIKVIQNIEKIEPKTKKIANLLKKLDIKKRVMIIISEKNQNVKLATRNIPNVYLETPSNLNAYAVIKNNELLISKEAIIKFK